MPVLYSIVYLTIYYASLGLVPKLYIPSTYCKKLPYDLAHMYVLHALTFFAPIKTLQVHG